MRPRRLLGFAGLGTIVVGALVAWRADSATPLIVIGGVLAVLGLVDWGELRTSHGEWSLMLRRAEERIAGVAEREDVPEEARDELAEAAQDVAAVVVAGTGRGPSIPAIQQPEPHHKHLGGSRVSLGLSQGSLFFRFRCSATDPTGETISATPRRGFSRLPVTAPLEAIYPDDFEGAPFPLRPGVYRVRWEAKSNFSILAGFTTVAADRFVIRRSGGNSGATEDTETGRHRHAAVDRLSPSKQGRASA